MDKFFHFLDASPTVYHAARVIAARFKEAGFTALTEGEKWKLEPGKSYFVSREDTLLAAFRLPEKRPVSAILLASHIDSPALKIKPHPEISTQGIGLLGTETYGGPLLHTWLDRDLALGGRIFVLNSRGQRESKIVLLEKHPVIIPGLAIHLNRDLNEKGLIVHKQDHLKAVFSLQHREHHFEDLLKQDHPFQTLLSFDLYLVPLEKARYNGANGELISSYRIDNLSSAFASLEALTHSKVHKERIQMAVFWDHEEIGSKTYAGADSVFIHELFERICIPFKMDREDYYRMKSASLCLSCDVAHAYHPNYADKCDPQNAPFMGKGPAVKFSPRYATSASTAAPLFHLAQKHRIPLQSYASRSDLPGGSTVGAMMGASPGIPTVDLGVACWAMHSIRETIAAADQEALTQLLTIALSEEL
ncbi:MAG: M18 family aminopeptidase [Verrucomicrobia bacterium]|nr:M18 family aminopeptidase [Verrucomicrobiota bacterium]MBU6446125.1 M18 family aminopeptidase [Verrucomicrobiota bacterium]MDE3047013.1 M18 family aminopeptidase [Verrucomicrobiota bacterium]